MDRLTNEVYALRTEISELRDTIKVLNCTLMQFIGTPNDFVENKYTPPSSMPSSLGVAAAAQEPQNQSSWQTSPAVVLPPPLATPPTVASTAPESKLPQPPPSSLQSPPQPHQTPSSVLVTDTTRIPSAKRRRNCLVDSSKFNFPLRSKEDLEAMEATLTTDCRDEIICEMERLLSSGGMKKNIMNIISPPNLIDYNIEGNHGKLCLRVYDNVLHALYTASSDKETVRFTEFLEELRRSLKLAKNKYFKGLCIARKKARGSTQLVTESENG